MSSYVSEARIRCWTGGSVSQPVGQAGSVVGGVVVPELAWQKSPSRLKSSDVRGVDSSRQSHSDPTTHTQQHTGAHSREQKPSSVT